MRKDRHYELTVPIGLRVYSGKGVYSEPLDMHDAKKIAKILFGEFEEKLANPRHCNAYGSIPFDLVFHDGFRSYYFTCWKITQDDKTLIETDYRKLGEYCRSAVKEKKE